MSTTSCATSSRAATERLMNGSRCRTIAPTSASSSRLSVRRRRLSVSAACAHSGAVQAMRARRVPVMWDSVQLSIGQRGVVRGIDQVAAVYVRSRGEWRLCDSQFDGSVPLHMRGFIRLIRAPDLVLSRARAALTRGLRVGCAAAPSATRASSPNRLSPSRAPDSSRPTAAPSSGAASPHFALSTTLPMGRKRRRRSFWSGRRRSG